LDTDKEVTRGFPEAIVVDPTRAGRVFVATRSGHLFASEDGGDHWDDLCVTVPEVANMKISQR
jgi:photosystem II stability/assembly factor-like uncharacterized protein